MGKLTIQEIAAVLMEKNGMDKSDANRFTAAMFSLIQERLETDHIVKVKGFGTFKIIGVEARESVSVRTGERVVIDGHSKVTFTPDATMKELVNKPFSQFETVVLNEGVEFDDMKDEDPVLDSEAETESEEQVTEAELVEEVPVVAPLVEMDVPESEPEPEPESEHESVSAPEPAPEPESEPVPEFVTSHLHKHIKKKKRSWSWLRNLLGILVLMALSALGGYYYAEMTRAVAPDVLPDTVYVKEVVKAKADTLKKADVEKNVPLAESDKQKDAKPEDMPEVKPAEKTVPKPVEKKSAATPAETADKYAQKDARVRYGAYRIVGLDHEVKVLAGQTFYSICRANLGPDMECYVEVYNNLPQNPTVKAGQIIKIPKLELKKKRK